jgi:hypothetical protein
MTPATPTGLLSSTAPASTGLGGGTELVGGAAVPVVALVAVLAITWAEVAPVWTVDWPPVPSRGRPFEGPSRAGRSFGWCALEPESVVVRQVFDARLGRVALADLEPGRAGVFFVGGTVERGACTAPSREWYGGAVSFLQRGGRTGGVRIESADRHLVTS